MSDGNTPQGIAEDEGNMSEADMAALIGTSVLDDNPESEDQPEPEQEAQEAEDDAPEDELSFLDDDDSEGDEADEDDQADEADKSRVASPTDTVRLADGTETTVEDLMKGSLREADYTRKTQELAEHRKETEALTQRVKDAETRATEQLQLATQLIEGILPPMPSPTLADPNHPDFDMVGYNQQRANHEAWKAYADEVKGKMSEQAEAAQKEANDQFNAMRNAEAQKLFEAVPEFRNDGKLNAFFKEAGDLLSTKYGIPKEQLANIPQHQFWLMTKDLMKLDRMTKKRMEAVRKSKGKPKVMKSGERRDGSGQAPKGLDKRVQQARTGRTDDAALAKLIGQSVLSK